TARRHTTDLGHVSWWSRVGTLPCPSLPPERTTPLMPDLAVVIPAYNEEGALARTVDQLANVLRGAGIDHELIVVDDGSKDSTSEIAETLDVTLVRHHVNRGYG